MNITIIAFGTRGDVQPTIALGQKLRANGHRVTLVTSQHFKTWIEQHGLEAAPSGVNTEAALHSACGLDWMEHGNSVFKQLRVMRDMLKQTGPQMTLDAWAACQGADAIISQVISLPFAGSIAEALGVPHLCMMLQPALLPTRLGAAVIDAPRPHRLSRLNWAFGRRVMQPAIWHMYGNLVNHFRHATLGLPPQTEARNRAERWATPCVLGYSREVVPHPADWPAHLHTTGYWFLDETSEWRPSPELQHFLDAGPAPVSIGFGSMTGRDPAALTRLLIDAVQLSGQRAVLLSGWAGLGELPLPANIFCLKAAPHEWLFPRLAAAVHHGGAGTVAASLRAGVPTVVVPHITDQPFWGARVAALGAGPNPIPRPHLTAHNLAEAIRHAATDPALRQRAQALGEKIRAEDGTSEAARWIEHYLQSEAVTRRTPTPRASFHLQTVLN